MIALCSDVIERFLKERSTILLDGGLATEIEAQGIKLDSDLWSAELLHSNPAAIVAAHRAYLAAGADCIITASYQASRQGLVIAGLSAVEADRLIVSSVELARQAIAGFLRDKPDRAWRPMVAASVGPYAAAVLHDGSEYTGAYDVDESDLIELHRDRLQLLDHSQPDIIACETIPNIMEASVLSKLLRDVSTPAWISFCCRDANSLSDGTSVRRAAEQFAGHPKVFAVGVNCTSPEYITPLIGQLRDAAPDKAIVVYPNSGESYNAEDKTWHGTTSPVEFAQAAVVWRQAGATVIGGCCRTGPDHIRAIGDKLKLPI